MHSHSLSQDALQLIAKQKIAKVSSMRKIGSTGMGYFYVVSSFVLYLKWCILNEIKQLSNCFPTDSLLWNEHLRFVSLSNGGSCSITVQPTLHNWEVVGSNPVWCMAFFSFHPLCILDSRSLKEVKHYWFSYLKICLARQLKANQN